EAKRGGADALLAFPQREHPVAYHEALGRELPVIAFYLYKAAGGVAYDNRTLNAILSLPCVIGIKVATLDSVTTFQRLASLTQLYRDKLLITGEDRFLGYSLAMGAHAALVGMGAALTDLQAAVLVAFRTGNFAKFVRLSSVCDRFAAATFTEPMEGYPRRMLWALAAEGVIPEDACDDPWGPGNSRASSGGETRVIRGTYGPRRIYTHLTARALALWKEHERRWQRRLYHAIGVLWLVEDDDQYETAALPALTEAGLAYERLTGAEVARRYPQINTERVRWAIFETDAGYLTARAACAAVLAAFQGEGGGYRQLAARPGA